MTKQEIIEAINSTIIANGQKGITAESLNLILNEIVDNSGEAGSGGGNDALTVMYDAGMFFDHSAMSMDQWVERYEDYAAAICENYPEECEMVQAQLEIFYTMTANNVETYRIIKERAKDNKSTSVILDLSFLYRMEAMIMGISIPTSLTIPCKMEYLDVSQMSELEEDLPFVERCIITPIVDINGCSLPPFILFENGYWSVPYIIYAHDGAGYTLNEDEKASNKECYDGDAISYAWFYIYTHNGNSTKSWFKDLHIINYGDHDVTYLDGADLKKLTLTEDGDAIITVIGSIGGQVTFYMPAGEEQTEEEKSKNKTAFDVFVASNGDANVRIMVNAEGLYGNYSPFGTVYLEGSNSIVTYLANLEEGVSVNTMTIASDGTVSLVTA